MNTISGASSASSSDAPSQFQQAKIAKDLQALATALTASDPKATQTALKQLVIDTAKSLPPFPAVGSAAAQDLSNVTAAVNSGDLPSAQRAFASFQSNLSTAFTSVNASSVASSSAQASNDLDFASSTGADSFDFTPESTFSLTV